MKKFDLFVEIDEYRMLSDNNKDIADKMNYSGSSLNEIKDFCHKTILKERAKKLKEKLNLSPRYAKCTLKNFKTDSEWQQKALKQANEYINLIKSGENKGKNLIIIGNSHVGTGKTHLGCAIVNALCDNGIPALFINSLKMFSAIRNTWNSTEYQNVEVLFIDDVGKEKVSEWGCQTLYEIINERYNNYRPTILTVENDISTLKEYYNKTYDGKQINKGNAIISRLTGDFDKITLCGEDYRHKR